MSKTTEPNDDAVQEEKRKRISEVKSARLTLTADALKALDEYQYKSGTYTAIDNLLNKYWWTPCATLIPIWMAPNLVTLMGFFLVVISFVTQEIIFCPDLGQEMEPPRWVCTFTGICMFLYQTLDAIDGKQARRTGTSSPLGQLFDHGVDALSTTALVLCTTTVLKYGFGVSVIMAMFSVQLSFWFAQYGEYHTHTMEHAVNGCAGVTEAQLGSIFVHLFAGVYGHKVFMIPLLGTPITARDIQLFICTSSGITISLFNFIKVMRHPGVDRRKALLQPIPMLALIAIGSAWTMIPTNRPLLVVGTLGLVSTYLTMWMVLCAMTRMDYPTFPSILYPLPPLFLVCLFRVASNDVDLLMGAYSCYVTYKTYKFVTSAVQEITAHLGINCLTIKKKD